MDIAIMIEGQNGLTWPRWQRMAQAVEDLGLAGLYRSDHFTNPQGPDIESLECWVSLTWLASHTQWLLFGPLVSPVSFRDPAMLARMGAAVDDLSGGRLTLGVGAGWQEREHSHFGYDLLDVRGRLARYREALEVITRLSRSDQPVDFDGQYYHLREAILLPRPLRPGGPPILVGGGRSVLPLAARYAQEWNTTFATPARFAELSARLDELLRQEGRQPGDIRRSIMTNLVFGRDEAEVRRKATATGRGEAELRDGGIVVGTGDQVVEQLGRLAEVGVQGVMLQWLDLDDIAGLEAFARAVQGG